MKGLLLPRSLLLLKRTQLQNRITLTFLREVYLFLKLGLQWIDRKPSQHFKTWQL